MNIYKKNPKVQGNVCIQGRLFDDNTLVYGSDWEPFTRPIAPGKEPLLVRVDENNISKEQTVQLAQQKEEPKQPRHMGPITSEIFQPIAKVAEEIGQELSSDKRHDEEDDDLSTSDVVKEVAVKIPSKLSSDYLIASFQGITENNVQKVLKEFDSLDEIAKAPNTLLRRVGIAPTFFSRVRDRAKELIGLSKDEE